MPRLMQRRDERKGGLCTAIGREKEKSVWLCYTRKHQ